MDNEGASNNERLLAAARTDDEDMIMEIFHKPGSFDINYKDGVGNTALHQAVLSTSIIVLEYILSHDECDVDPIDDLNGDTPLHVAVKLEDPKDRALFVEVLLDAGADYGIRNKNGQTAQDLVRPDDEEVLLAFRRSQAEARTDDDDIAYDDDSDVASE